MNEHRCYWSVMPDSRHMAVCTCNTVANINDLIANAKKEGYDKGIEDTYLQCWRNGWFRDTARKKVMAMFKHFKAKGEQKGEKLL